jgi:hypothetical protein
VWGRRGWDGCIYWETPGDDADRREKSYSYHSCLTHSWHNASRACPPVPDSDTISHHISAPLLRLTQSCPSLIHPPLVSSSVRVRWCFRTLLVQRISRSCHQPFVSLHASAPPSRSTLLSRPHRCAFTCPCVHCSSYSVYSRLHPSLQHPVLRSLSNICQHPVPAPWCSFGVADRQMDGSSLHRYTHHTWHPPPWIHNAHPRSRSGS